MFARIEIQTRNKVDFIEITAEVQQAVTEKAIDEGICFVYCPHTTAGIVLNENWDPTVEQDVTMLLECMVPENLPFRHEEGNSTSHIKSILVGSDHFIFVQEQQLQLGQWQGIFLAEFDGPRRRTIWIKVVPDVASG